MTFNSILAEISNVSVTLNGLTILDNINLTIQQHEQWAIIGHSGSGKTTLAHALTGKSFHKGTVSFSFADGKPHTNNIVCIEQQHQFKNLSNTSNFYYQQRFNSIDGEDSITVQQALQTYFDTDEAATDQLVQQLQLSLLLQKPLIQLSNGENKRLQLAKALLKKPAVLVMDNPFVGLDTAGRQILNQLMNTITQQGIHIILITSPQELPDCITHIAVLEKGKLVHSGKKEMYTPTLVNHPQADQPLFNEALLHSLVKTSRPGFNDAILMKNVTVRYGDKIILDNINWQVKRGDRWNIAGPNGAGKSTLLSLVNGDNPQAYSNEIYLFDRRRGTGESIWDIKRNIGYVSPELHLFFDRSVSCFDAVASGLFDTIGLFRQLNEAQYQQTSKWIELLQLRSSQRKMLFQLSLGQQRMIMLARALVKNPPLLILDEPCQGLDEEQSLYFKNLIDLICTTADTTLLYVSHYQKDIPVCVTNYLQLNNGVATNAGK